MTPALPTPAFYHSFARLRSAIGRASPRGMAMKTVDVSHELRPYRASQHAHARWAERFGRTGLDAAYQRAILSWSDDRGVHYLIDPETRAQFIVHYDPSRRVWAIATVYPFVAPTPQCARRDPRRLVRWNKRKARR